MIYYFFLPARVIVFVLGAVVVPPMELLLSERIASGINHLDRFSTENSLRLRGIIKGN